MVIGTTNVTAAVVIAAVTMLDGLGDVLAGGAKVNGPTPALSDALATGAIE